MNGTQPTKPTIGEHVLGEVEDKMAQLKRARNIAWDTIQRELKAGKSLGGSSLLDQIFQDPQVQNDAFGILMNNYDPNLTPTKIMEVLQRRSQWIAEKIEGGEGRIYIKVKSGPDTPGGEPLIREFTVTINCDLNAVLENIMNETQPGLLLSSDCQLRSPLVIGPEAMLVLKLFLAGFQVYNFHGVTMAMKDDPDDYLPPDALRLLS